MAIDMRNDRAFKQAKEIVMHQLRMLWPYELHIGDEIWHLAQKRMEQCLLLPLGSAQEERSVFSPLHGVQYAVYLYYLGNTAYKMGCEVHIPTLIYSLNKLMHSVDWFYEIELPACFGAEHPLGSVLGRATYGKGLFLYQGTTVGGSPDKAGKPQYPVLGEHVVLFANSSVLGKCNIGSHVMLGTGTRIINQDVPDNALVFGASPNLDIHKRDGKEMKERTERFFLRAKRYAAR